MKLLKYLIPIFAGLVVGLVVFAANVFPASLNVWEYGDIIEEDWANSLEETIGVTNSSDTDSHDYLIRHGSSAFSLAAKDLTLTYGLTAATGTFSGYITALGFTGKSSTTAAFASNPTNCLANQYPLGIDASGNVEGCTADANTTYTADNPVTLTGTVFGIPSASTTLWETDTNTTYTGTYPIILTGTAFGFSDNLSLTYGLSAATGTFSGLLTATGGILSQASSTFTGTVDMPGTTITGAFLYPAFTYATSSWSGTTTIALGSAFVAEKWSSVQCFTTAGSISLRFGDGTNKMNWVVASTTVGQTALSTNNTFTAQETRYVDLGSASGATQVSCTVRKQF